MVPCQTSECIPVGLCEMVSAPVDILSYIGHTCDSADRVGIDSPIGSSGNCTVFSAAVGVAFKELFPLCAQIYQMVREAKVLLCNLQLGHHSCLLHGAKQRAEGLSRLEIYRPVLHLNDHILTELSLQWHKLIIGLFGTIFTAGIVDKCPPHHDAPMWLQSISQHIGTLGMATAVILRSGESLRIGFHQEPSEIGYQTVYLIHLGVPPLLYLRIKRIGVLQSPQLGG